MPTGDMWGPASEPGSPPISSNRRQHRRRKGKTAKQRRFNWIVGVLLLLILLAIGDHQKPTSSSPTSTSSSPAATSVDVSVVKSGFTQNTKTVVDLISYGLILRNNNSDLTALDVKVTTTFLDSFGQPLDTDVKTVTGIPPLGTFIRICTTRELVAPYVSYPPVYCVLLVSFSLVLLPSAPTLTGNLCSTPFNAVLAISILNPSRVIRKRKFTTNAVIDWGGGTMQLTRVS